MISGDHNPSQLIIVMERRAFDSLCVSLASPYPCSGSWNILKQFSVATYMCRLSALCVILT